MRFIPFPKIPNRPPQMNHPLDSTSTPVYIKWMIADIEAEEEIPDFVNPKAIGGVAARFYKELI